MEIVHAWHMSFFEHDLKFVCEKESPFQETSFSGSIHEILGSQNWIISLSNNQKIENSSSGDSEQKSCKRISKNQ